MVNLNNVYNKLNDLIIGSEYLEIYDLQDNFSVNELIHIAVNKNDLPNLSIVDIDLKKQISFTDDKYSILCPYFKIVRKGA